ncbi:MAG TPA: universal stress protein [Anaerolineaceae bacterium]
MFKHLLVPLDGSKLAEASLPAAVTLCRVLGSAVMLLHIIEKDVSPEIHGDRHLTNEEDACKYLDQVARDFFPPEVEVETHVHTEQVSDITRSIVDHTGEFAPDLIVMCTHGEGGWREFMMGSIAQQVIGRARTPILLVKAGEPGVIAFTAFKKILVPLDGELEHEQCLPVAAELARQFNAGLNLMTVVPTLGTLAGKRAATGWMLPGTTRAILDIDEQTASEYLEKMALEQRAAGIKVTTFVQRGDPAQQILNAAQPQDFDLIVLVTHGKGGMRAFWAGSVGPRVVIEAKIPLLLMPVKRI